MTPLHEHYKEQKEVFDLIPQPDSLKDLPLYNKAVQAYITSLTLSLIDSEIERKEGMRKQPADHPIPCPDGNPGCAVYHAEKRLSREDFILNQATDEDITYLQEQRKIIANL